MAAPGPQPLMGASPPCPPLPVPVPAASSSYPSDLAEPGGAPSSEQPPVGLDQPRMVGGAVVSAHRVNE